MSNPALMRQRARHVWHVALGASWIALLGLPVGALATDTPVGIIVGGLGVVALLVMLVAAFLALWLRLGAGDAERRSALEASRQRRTASHVDRDRPV